MILGPFLLKMQFISFWRDSEFDCWTFQRLERDGLWKGLAKGKGEREKNDDGQGSD